MISKKNPIVFGTLLLSISGLICRGIGFIYHLFIARTFGEEAMGIFQLTSPILMLAFSFTCAGFQTAISKFTAGCLGQHQKEKATLYLLCGTSFSVTISVIYSFIVFYFADFIAITLLKERQCTLLLKICAISFPLSTFHSCLNGYFYGTKNTKVPAFTQIAEQLIRVGSVLLIYYIFNEQNKHPSIAITCIGLVLGEFIACVISLFCYMITNNTTWNLTQVTHQTPSTPMFHKMQSREISQDILTFSIPLIVNRVLINLLQSYETISLPTALRTYGYSSKAALSIYGVLTGMAMNLVLFPSTFTNSFSVLLLPAVSEAHSKNQFSKLKLTIRKTIFLVCC